VNDCDLVLECWVYGLESLKNLASDPEWIQTALEDENDWLDTPRSTIRIGYDTTYLEYAGIMDVTGPKRRSRVSASFDWLFNLSTLALIACLQEIRTTETDVNKPFSFSGVVLVVCVDNCNSSNRRKHLHIFTVYISCCHLSRIQPCFQFSLHLIMYQTTGP
jgi:hypothetical protein